MVVVKDGIGRPGGARRYGVMDLVYQRENEHAKRAVSGRNNGDGFMSEGVRLLPWTVWSTSGHVVSGIGVPMPVPWSCTWMGEVFGVARLGTQGRVHPVIDSKWAALLSGIG
jgi:hypothetical protein